MNLLGTPPQTWFARPLRYFGYFLIGALFGLLPALLLIGSADVKRFPWTIFALILTASGLLFCLLGIASRGRLIAGLLRFLGREVDPPS